MQFNMKHNDERIDKSFLVSEGMYICMCLSSVYRMLVGFLSFLLFVWFCFIVPFYIQTQYRTVPWHTSINNTYKWIHNTYICMYIANQKTLIFIGSIKEIEKRRERERARTRWFI